MSKNSTKKKTQVKIEKNLNNEKRRTPIFGASRFPGEAKRVPGSPALVFTCIFVFEILHRIEM